MEEVRQTVGISWADNLPPSQHPLPASPFLVGQVCAFSRFLRKAHTHTFSFYSLSLSLSDFFTGNPDDREEEKRLRWDRDRTGEERDRMEGEEEPVLLHPSELIISDPFVVCAFICVPARHL